MQKLALVVVVVAGCAGTTGRAAEPPSASPNPHLTVEPIDEDLGEDLAAPAPASAPSAAAVATDDAPYPADILSVRFLKSTTLIKAPGADPDRDRVGVIRKDARAGVKRAVPGDAGCAGRWLELVPRGWTCESAVEPSHDAPSVATAPSLTDDTDDDRPPVRGLYGTVRGKDAVAFSSRSDAVAGENGRVLVGSNSVRATAVVTVNGRRFWRTSGGDLIDASAIRRFSPSKFKGVVLDPQLAADAPLPAWIRARKDPKEPAVVRATPTSRGRIVRELEPRTVVTILESSDDGRFVRIDDDAWVARADLRVATRMAPPPGTGVDEKWFDVDLDEQVLVAYQGERPVYATMVSTGKYGHRTPTRITRLKAKLERATMASDDTEVYSVADVPWTMYYDDNGYALHTSYWHNGFGGTRSHGCINLAPHDARVLYSWSSPDVPPGWTAVYGDEDNPGSLVRVRSRREPEPAFRGYARKMIASR